jgi:hypothetical protein
MPPAGSAVTGSDILIGKTATLPELITPGMEQRKKKRDTSMGMRPQEKGIVDKVMLSTDKDGQKFVKVGWRMLRLSMLLLLTYACCHLAQSSTHVPFQRASTALLVLAAALVLVAVIAACVLRRG